jgi:hypothetical protein
MATRAGERERERERRGSDPTRRDDRDDRDD